MPTYFERYLNGETNQVWDELMALGAQVRQEPHYADALAVAQETMTRVRQNIEMVYERLQTIGFAFEAPDRAYVPPQPSDVENLARFEREIGPVPLSLKAWVEIVGEVDFRGNYPGLSYYAPSPGLDLLETYESLMSQQNEALFQQYGMPQIDHEMLDVVRNFLEAEEQKRGHQMHQEPNEVTLADPLCMTLGRLSVDYYEHWQEMQKAGEAPGELTLYELLTDFPAKLGGLIVPQEVFTISVAPDIEHKSNFSGSGGHDIALPDGGADAPLLYERHHTTFVNYLRLSFLWGGFPGLEHETKRNDDLLDRLREGLLPI